MNDFFNKEFCDRCGGSLEEGRIMSMLNNQCICMNCKAKEEKLPEYKEALEKQRLKDKENH